MIFSHPFYAGFKTSSGVLWKPGVHPGHVVFSSWPPPPPSHYTRQRLNLQNQCRLTMNMVLFRGERNLKTWWALNGVLTDVMLYIVSLVFFILLWASANAWDGSESGRLYWHFTCHSACMLGDFFIYCLIYESDTNGGLFAVCAIFNECWAKPGPSGLNVTKLEQV